MFSIFVKILRRFRELYFKRSLTLPDWSINYTPEDICLGDYCTDDLTVAVFGKEAICFMFKYGALSLSGYTLIDG